MHGPGPIAYAELEQELKEKCHAVVPFRVSHKEFQEAIDVFVKFLALPLETKEKIHFKIRPEDRGTEVGYRRYLRDEGQTDNREYVHYHRLAEERFAEKRRQIPELDELLRSMKRIHDEAVGTVHQIMLALDERFPGISNKIENHYLRFLKYDRAKPGEFLAKGHYDRGSCTLALAESAPGLRMGVDDQHLKEIVHHEGEALFMPGLKFSLITSGEFVPTWHDVVQKGDDAYSDDIARWAIVLFADAKDMPIITYDEAHTPRRRD